MKCNLFNNNSMYNNISQHMNYVYTYYYDTCIVLHNNVLHQQHQIGLSVDFTD